MARSVDHLTATPRMALTPTLRRASEGRVLWALGMDGACVIRKAFLSRKPDATRGASQDALCELQRWCDAVEC